MPEEDETQAAKTAGALADVNDILAPILEAVTGYRAQIEAAGFSPTAAEAMAMEYHSTLMKMMAAAMIGATIKR